METTLSISTDKRPQCSFCQGTPKKNETNVYTIKGLSNWIVHICTDCLCRVNSDFERLTKNK